MSNARYYRAQAELLLQMAGQMSDPSSERTMRESAAEYLKRAEEIENSESAKMTEETSGTLKA
jgi:hypothetical protein